MIKMTKEQIEAKYTPEEIEAIFRYQEMKYTVEDANFHIDEFIEWHDNITEEEQAVLKSYAEEMAEGYLYKYMDCSVDENTVWEHLVEMYYEERVKKND